VSDRICDLCKENAIDSTCVDCGKEICVECDSGYYSDETLCVECRKQITPEEEEADRKAQTEYDEDALPQEQP